MVTEAAISPRGRTEGKLSVAELAEKKEDTKVPEKQQPETEGKTGRSAIIYVEGGEHVSGSEAAQ